jgi:starch synthase
MWALDEALKTIKDRAAWDQLVRNGMEKDFSWDRSAEAYIDVYRRAIEKI